MKFDSQSFQGEGNFGMLINNQIKQICDAYSALENNKFCAGVKAFEMMTSHLQSDQKWVVAIKPLNDEYDKRIIIWNSEWGGIREGNKAFEEAESIKVKNEVDYSKKKFCELMKLVARKGLLTTERGVFVDER